MSLPCRHTRSLIRPPTWSVRARRVLPSSSSGADPRRHSHRSPTAARRELALPSSPTAHSPGSSPRAVLGLRTSREVRAAAEQRTEGASEEATGGQGEPPLGAWPCHLEGTCPFQRKAGPVAQSEQRSRLSCSENLRSFLEPHSVVSEPIHDADGYGAGQAGLQEGPRNTGTENKLGGRNVTDLRPPCPRGRNPP